MAEKESLSPAEGESGGFTEDPPAPVGTLFVMTIYLAILSGMWGVMYWRLLGQ
jgi:hypothetical protein